MGARINKYGRRKGDDSTVPKIDYYLRYRTCKRYGHRRTEGGQCSRCCLRDGDGLMQVINIVTIENLRDQIVKAITVPNPFHEYLRGRK